MISFTEYLELSEENVGIAKKAKDAVNQAKRSGKIKQPKTCSKCGVHTSNLEAAHDDYRKPMSIRWLCKSCHSKDNKSKTKKRKPMGIYNPSGKWPKKY